MIGEVMGERLTTATAVLAGAGLLVGCNSEQSTQTPDNTPRELIVAHETTFGEPEVEGLATNVIHTPLEIGARVVGICVLDTRDEIAPEANTGFMRVKWNDRVGTIRTFEKTTSSETVDTFMGMPENELVRVYGRCLDSPQG
jgi:hypothetical protein